jgi:hypothetical protein
MPTVMVDPDDVQWVECEPTPGFKRIPIRERLTEPLHAEAECYVLAGRPHLLFASWDYAEDWSGEYVREVHPFAVLAGQEIGEQKWRARLQQLQGA